MANDKKIPNFVCIEKNKYSFYTNGLHDITVESNNITKEQLEFYRKNIDQLKIDALGEEVVDENNIITFADWHKNCKESYDVPLDVLEKIWNNVINFVIEKGADVK